jgi:aminoglycoside phosphotransferase (APT) family kinase protein
MGPEQFLALWEQFGALLRQIHSVAGEHFGDPPPGQAFARLSEALEYRLTQSAARLRMLGLAAEADRVEAVLGLVRGRRILLDEVVTPRLLHGDLWLFNLLIREDGEAGAPRIVGVLDADRAWWGEPAADWTMFVLAKAQDKALGPAFERFWAGYGARPTGGAAAFRADVYEAMHIGMALCGAARAGDGGTVARGQAELPEVVERLQRAEYD